MNILNSGALFYIRFKRLLPFFKLKNSIKTEFRQEETTNIKSRSKWIDRLLSKGEIQKILLREKARTDRNNNDFSFIVIDIGEKEHDKMFIAYLSQFLESRLRSIDEIGWYENNQIGIVLPYTSKENAIKVAESVFKNLKTDTPVKLVHIFSYPSIWPFKNDNNHQVYNESSK